MLRAQTNLAMAANILLIGGAGFIGAHMGERLVGEVAEVLTEPRSTQPQDARDSVARARSPVYPATSPLNVPR